MKAKMCLAYVYWCNISDSDTVEFYRLCCFWELLLVIILQGLSPMMEEPIPNASSDMSTPFHQLSLGSSSKFTPGLYYDSHRFGMPVRPSNTHGSTSGCSCDVFGKWPPRSINWAVTWWCGSGVRSRCCKTHAATTSCCSSFLRRVASKWSSRNFKHPICISNVARSNWPGLWEAYKFTIHELQACQANSISSHSAC